MQELTDPPRLSNKITRFCCVLSTAPRSPRPTRREGPTEVRACRTGYRWLSGSHPSLHFQSENVAILILILHKSGRTPDQHWHPSPARAVTVADPPGARPSSRGVCVPSTAAPAYTPRAPRGCVAGRLSHGMGNCGDGPLSTEHTLQAGKTGPLPSRTYRRINKTMCKTKRRPRAPQLLAGGVAAGEVTHRSPKGLMASVGQREAGGRPGRRASVGKAGRDTGQRCRHVRCEAGAVGPRQGRPPGTGAADAIRE